MTSRPARVAVPAVLAVLMLVLGSSLVFPSAVLARPRSTRTTDPVTVTVTSVTPTVPVASTTRRSLTVTVQVHNTSSRTVTGATLDLYRGDPIGSVDTLAAAQAAEPTTRGALSVPGDSSAPLDLSPGGSGTMTFRATTSTTNDRPLCLCSPSEVYPLILSLRGKLGGQVQTVGQAQTFVPSLDGQPALTHKMQVAWLWPIIDRPHRLGPGSVFTDDELATSVATGGRLDRILEVAERVASTKLPLTLMIDPELLDELEIVATGRYTVRATSPTSSESAGSAVTGSPTGSSTASESPAVASDSASSVAASSAATTTATSTSSNGAGQAAATAWLSRLRALLTTYPSSHVDVQLTPYADPDVSRLSAHEQPWTMDPPASATANVSKALDGRTPEHTVAWLPGTLSTASALGRLAQQGVATAILSSSALTPPAAADVAQPASEPSTVTRVRSSAGTMRTILTSPELISAASRSVGGSLGSLPLLTASLAARVAQEPDEAHTVLLAPSRYVDPDVSAAVRTITDTSRSALEQPATVSAVGETTPSGTSTLRQFRSGSANLSDTSIDTIVTTTPEVSAARSLIGSTASGRSAAAQLATAVQLQESASGSAAASAIDGPRQNRALALSTSARLATLLGSVRILKPSSGSYTLTSTTSALPITLRNDSPYDVAVHLSVIAANGLTGFTTRPPAVVRVPADSTQAVRIPSRIQRSGRIPVQATLSTANGHELGPAVALAIHSTALGAIGVVITVIAGVVLFLALLVRYIRRVQRIRRKRHRAERAGGSADAGATPLQVSR